MMPDTFAPIPDGQYHQHTLNQIRRQRRREPELTRMIEGRPCPRCKVPPGQLCRSPDGLVAFYHAGRTGA